MKIILLGATGAIGRLLTPRLVQAGHAVVGSTRSPDKFPAIAALGARPVALNALDREGVFALLRAERPAAVVNMLTDLAGLDLAANGRLRLEGSRHIADAAVAVGVSRLVAESIAWMYAPGSGPAGEGEPLDVDAPEPRRRSVVAVRTLENAVAELPLGVSLRFGILYGPGTWYARDGLMAEQAARGELAADGDMSSFVHVDDAAGAAVDALEWPTGAVNVCDDVPAAGHDWVPVFCRAVGASDPAVITPAERHGWARGASNEHARKKLNWTPAYPSWREGFAHL